MTRIDRSSEDQRIDDMRRRDEIQRAAKASSNKAAFEKTLSKETAEKVEKPRNFSTLVIKQLTKPQEDKAASTEKQKPQESKKSSDTEKKIQKREGDASSSTTQQADKAEHSYDNAITGNSNDQQGQQGQSFSDQHDTQDDDFFAQAASAGRAENLRETMAKSLPDGFFDSIADQVSVGVDQEGLSHFTIDLREGILGGSSIDVSANGKSVSLSFRGLDEGSKRLLNASQKELASRLRSKGLRLSGFDLQ